MSLLLLIACAASASNKGPSLKAQVENAHAVFVMLWGSNYEHMRMAAAEIAAKSGQFC